MITAEQYRELAHRLLAQLPRITSEEVRTQLTTLAAQYEQLALFVETATARVPDFDDPATTT
jgi:hypothetical protein